jgi:phosphatidylinositol-3-phosphatase
MHLSKFLARLGVGGLGLTALLIFTACATRTTTSGASTVPTEVPIATAVAPTSPSISAPPRHGPTATPSINELTSPPSATGNPSPAVSPSAIPAFSHIYTIVMENKEYGTVVGNRYAPYLNSLIAQFGVATNYTGVAHPSEPNYFALFSGSTQGATGDGVYNLAGHNLADQIEAKDKTWKVFAENVPLNCYTGVVAYGGEDGAGTYARKHNPAISFTDISRSPARCANITDLTHFDPAAANYELIVPNLCNDMHDCSVAVGDNFLSGFVPKILNSQAWQQGGVLFITWDEGSTNRGGGGYVPLLVISKQVEKGFRSAVAYNHYSLVRTVEDAWGLGCLNQACSANNLAEFFH